ncbi:MAG: penicillin-binding protein 2 [Aquificae bacterium]|nr:penicillin-binding protein 2 [Aquificota bacterium]
MEQLIRYKQKEKGFKGRIALVFFGIILLSLGILVRLIYINVFKDKVLKEQVESISTVRIQVFRAPITDKNGIPLAVSFPVGYVYVYKFYKFNDEKKKKIFIEGLSRILRVPEGELERRLKSRKDFFELITFPADKVPEVELFIKSIDYDEKRNRYTKPEIRPHVGVGTRYQRFYPHKYLASNIIGFVQREKGEGGEGLELQYDTLLAGSPAKEREFIVYNLGKMSFVEPKLPVLNDARELKTSLDYRVQAVIEDIKKKIIRKWRPKTVVIIVMETQTGKIRGFTTYPHYDPNRYEKFFPHATRNFGTYDLFEPGSTFKPFLVAYAVDKGFIRKNSLININRGRLKVHKKTIRDPVAYLRKKLYITPAEVLVYSSNVGAIKIGMRLSPEDFDKLLRTFHLHKTPGVIFNERNPRISKLSNEVNKAYASIGQGVAFNALHLLTSFNALITGRYTKPSFLEDEETQSEPINISPSTVRWLRDVLIKVVEEGTGKRAKSDYYYIGGKTGTAQQYDKHLRRYSKSHFTTFFIGFFPSEPKFVALILVDKPRGKEVYGGTVSAPYFKELAERIGAIYGLKPDKK